MLLFACDVVAMVDQLLEEPVICSYVFPTLCYTLVLHHALHASCHHSACPHPGQPQLAIQQTVSHLMECVQDLLAHLRPGLERVTEYEQAAEAVAAIEASEARSAAAGPAGLGAIEEEDSDSNGSHDNSGSDSDAEGEPADL